MDRAKWPALAGLVAGTVYLCKIVPSTFAFDKPLLTATTCLITLGYSLVLLGRLLRKDAERFRSDGQFAIDPLVILKELRSLRQNPGSPRDLLNASGIRGQRISLLLLAAATSIRVQIFVWVLGNVQCATQSLASAVPLAFAAWEAWNARQQSQGLTRTNDGGRPYGNEQNQALRIRSYRLLAVTFVASGGMLALAVFRSPTSTFICPSALNSPYLTPLIQFTGTAVDALIVYAVSRLLHDEEGASTNSLGPRLVATGKALPYAALFSAAILIIETIVYYLAFSSVFERKHIFVMPRLYAWSALKLNVAFCFTAVCAIVLMSQVDVTTTILIPTFTAITTLTFSNAWSERYEFPPIHGGFGLVAFTLAVAGFAAYFHFDPMVIDGTSQPPPLFRRRPIGLYACLLLIFLAQAGLWASHSSNFVSSHPIDQLLNNAQISHETYLSQASSSKTLNEAVKAYRERYVSAPPPGFEHWYAYATARNSVIIDDYDSIYRDLRQFHALQPAQIREATWVMISNQWHDAAGISIRGGIPTIAHNVVPTHRWMLEGVVGLLRGFAEWLPDMDLAFNINDEPRVAQPYHMVHAREGYGPKPQIRPLNSFSDNRATQWREIPAEGVKENKMTQYSGQRTFYDLGSNACPPESLARSQRQWDVSRLCTECYEPHSTGAFLSNWTLSADVCHQPDLADLHGLYISPASVKSADVLYPVFSQSKANGFSDILYPSAWNYLLKTKYEPNEEHPDVPYTNKNPAIYWRGMTTEGLSHDFGHWTGMTRQRYVHMTSPHHNDSYHHSILLPINDPSALPRYKYTSVPDTQLKQLLPTDIQFVNEINRCAGIDCLQQTREFSPLAPRADFQQNWAYKFLLDMDGAGFSGRFLPFLRSHSLPFKTALYREWWDDRVTPWLHFVPLDLRGQGFWATLAYFAGFDGNVNGRRVKASAHDTQGERIAEAGREWADTVLRREDMEIYMFRLLLEWGRMTDDRRDEIGFDMDDKRGA